jgi:hypothetical protein
VISAQLVIAALAQDGPETCLTDTQLRTMLFMLNVEAPKVFDRPHFDWQPGPFGPVSPAVSILLDEVGDQGLAIVRRLGRQKRIVSPIR